MTGDLIEKADALIKPMQCYTETWLVEAEHVLPQLVAEVNRLRAQVENCHAAKNLHARRSEKLQEQLAAKDIELSRWQQIAIEAKAEAIFWMEQTAPSDDDPEWDAIGKDWADAYREQAAQELNLQATQPDDDNLTIAYMLGGKKADERREVLQGYVARLEKAYLADSMQSEELARGALNKIREGKP